MIHYLTSLVVFRESLITFEQIWLGVVGNQLAGRQVRGLEEASLLESLQKKGLVKSVVLSNQMKRIQVSTGSICSVREELRAYVEKLIA